MNFMSDKCRLMMEKMLEGACSIEEVINEMSMSPGEKIAAIGDLSFIVKTLEKNLDVMLSSSERIVCN